MAFFQNIKYDNKHIYLKRFFFNDCTILFVSFNSLTFQPEVLVCGGFTSIRLAPHAEVHMLDDAFDSDLFQLVLLYTSFNNCTERINVNHV